MSQYTRIRSYTIIWTICAVLSGLFAMVVAALFFKELYLIVFCGIIFMLLILWICVIDEAIRIEISDAHLRFYKRQALKYDLNLRETLIRDMSHRSRLGNSGYFIAFTNQFGKRVVIDCASLGKEQYTKLIQEIKSIQGE